MSAFVELNYRIAIAELLTAGVSLTGLVYFIFFLFT